MLVTSPSKLFFFYLWMMMIPSTSYAFVVTPAPTTTTNFKIQSPLGQPRRSFAPKTYTAAISASTAQSVPDMETMEGDKDDDTFDWFKSWYPIVPVEILDIEKPHKFQLLGMDLVIWNDGIVDGDSDFGPKSKKNKKANRRKGGEWRAFRDECPHRKVPLSEGRVEKDGSLLCSYHAWRFNGAGECVAVPQIMDAAKTATEEDKDFEQWIQNNPKSSCHSFPTKVIEGLLWVWPDASDDGRLQAALTDIPYAKTVESIDDKDRLWVGPYNFRELPYGADYFIENVVDPAHVQVSHHNVVGSRYNDHRAKMKTTTSVTKHGFEVSVSSEGSASKGITTFQAPCLVTTGGEMGTNGGKQILELYASPSRPGFCNHMGRMVIQKDNDNKLGPLLRQFTLPLPIWLNHVMAAAFLNQDGLFLHHQERTLAKTNQYASYYYEDTMATTRARVIPTNSSTTAKDHKPTPMNYNNAVLPIEVDKGVINFRNWLRFKAGGYIPYKNNPVMPEANNEIVFDQWNGHTKYCSICQRALKNLKRIRFLSFFLSTCLGVVRPFGNKNIFNLGSVFVTAGFGLLVSKLIGMFYRYEYSHAHND